MDQVQTIYDFDYFDSRDEAERALGRYSETLPLTLPEQRLLVEIAAALNVKATTGEIAAKDLLFAYQRLRENHEHTDVFCAWKIANGGRCGGLMDVEVDAAGAFFLCRVDKNHRTPK